jgi:hypothetical protein
MLDYFNQHFFFFLFLTFLMDHLYQNAYLPQTDMYRPHNDDAYWSHHPIQPTTTTTTTTTSAAPYSYYAPLQSPRPKITTNVWEDEATICFQVDAKGICVARRQGIYTHTHITE